MTLFSEKSDKKHPCRNEGLRTSRTRRKLEPLLQSWHGEDEAEGKIMEFLPQTRSLAETLDRVMARTLPFYLHELTKIQEHWTELAGSVAASHTTPVKLYQGVLSVEVSHPAYRTVLMSKKISAVILEKITALCGEGACRELRLIPAGGRADAMKNRFGSRSKTGSAEEKSVKMEKKQKKTSE